MPDIIHLLPDNVANQIAAGEVIQRPASVVKELMENAVDAGATKIELHIKDAGKTLIQVVDNGKGMTELDARMSFERHATSKLTSADDLFHLTTKGFRGEALASIAAIAHVEMETIASGMSIGTKIEIAGSKINNLEPSSRSVGTSISVKNLFFNVPARRNFLKSDNIETKHIVEEFNRIVLTHPEVSFQFSHNGNVLNNLEAGGLRKRVVDLMGNSFNNKLVPIEEETEIVKIRGYIVKPEFSRKTRGEQYFFVNRRYFKDNYLHHSVVNAYDNLIDSKRFPSYFIYLEVPTESLDVNIHPTKTEVKFTDERSVYQILMSTIRSALGRYNIAPSLDFNREPQFDLSTEDLNRPIRKPQIDVDPNYNPFKSGNLSGKDGQFSRGLNGGGYSSLKPLKPNKEDWEEFYKITETDLKEGEKTTEQLTFSKEETNFYTNKMQLHKKLVLIQIKSGLLLVHINRAKERILYNDLIHHFMLTPIVSQQLLFPLEHTLQAQQKLEWENNHKTLDRLGFKWEWRGNTIVLSGLPSVLEIENGIQCIDSILEKITYQNIGQGEIVHELILSLSSSATKNQVKMLQKEEIDSLVERLFQCEEHQYSPSGKRIVQTISMDELNNYL